MRKIIKIVICSLLIFMIPNAVVHASEVNDCDSGRIIPVSITWYSDINGDVPVEIIYDGVSIQYTYDENMMRRNKLVEGVVVSEYNYSEGRLISENKLDFNIQYHYTDNNGIIKPSGFTYQMLDYSYGYVDGVIRFIYDAQNDIVAEYEYDIYGRLASVINYGSSNELNDEYLPGNVNSLVGRGDVYDKEIGFYYMSGLYYSPLVQKFLSKNLEIEFVEYDLAPAVMVEDEIVNMYSTLRATSGYGADIPYYVTGPGWTLSVSDGELLARLIYGECTYSSTGYYDQRAAIAWVIKDRKSVV